MFMIHNTSNIFNKQKLRQYMNEQTPQGPIFNPNELNLRVIIKHAIDGFVDARPLYPLALLRQLLHEYENVLIEMTELEGFPSEYGLYPLFKRYKKWIRAIPSASIYDGYRKAIIQSFEHIIPIYKKGDDFLREDNMNKYSEWLEELKDEAEKSFQHQTSHKNIVTDLEAMPPIRQSQGRYIYPGGTDFWDAYDRTYADGTRWDTHGNIARRKKSVGRM